VVEGLLTGTDWYGLLESEFAQAYWRCLKTYLDQQRAGGEVFPPHECVFRALCLTNCADTKVVIVGQDPYPGLGQADGLCFSVDRGTRIPPSLRNIRRELQDDLGLDGAAPLVIPDDGSLAPWADRGVLLLNTVLTVRAGEPGSHRRMGWEQFTDAVIRKAVSCRDPVFILWGRDAKRTGDRLGLSSKRVIASAHPSPRSAYRGFFKSSPFSRANAILRDKGQEPFDWSLG
jgi:uracil-DNA glycosylase